MCIFGSGTPGECRQLSVKSLAIGSTASIPDVKVKSGAPGHAFISYVHEDAGRVDDLQHALEAAGVPVWRDTGSLFPGQDWRAVIRHAISDDALVFLACFSTNSEIRRKSYQNEELVLATDQIRLRRPGVSWLIPIRFDDCQIPDLDIGAGRTLASLQQADLFGPHHKQSATRLITAVQNILGRP